MPWGRSRRDGPSSVTHGICATPVVGSVIGAKPSCSVLGPAALTSYRFQLIAFRGTLNVNTLFGPLSNVVIGTTAASSATRYWRQGAASRRSQLQLRPRCPWCQD